MLDTASSEDCPFSRADGGVTVAVWPWTDHGAVTTRFGVDLLSRQILPVQLVIANRSEETVRFSSTQVDLICGEVLRAQVLSDGEMSRRTEKNTATAPFLIYIGTLGLGAPISGAMGASLENDNLRNRELRRDTYLSAITLDAGRVMSGFLFFDIPREIRLRKELPLDGRVIIRRLLMSSGRNLAFDIPVSIQ